MEEEAVPFSSWSPYGCGGAKQEKKIGPSDKGALFLLAVGAVPGREGSLRPHHQKRARGFNKKKCSFTNEMNPQRYSAKRGSLVEGLLPALFFWGKLPGGSGWRGKWLLNQFATGASLPKAMWGRTNIWAKKGEALSWVLKRLFLLLAGPWGWRQPKGAIIITGKSAVIA